MIIFKYFQRRKTTPLYYLYEATIDKFESYEKNKQPILIKWQKGSFIKRLQKFFTFVGKKIAVAKFVHFDGPGSAIFSPSLNLTTKLYYNPTTKTFLKKNVQIIRQIQD